MRSSTAPFADRLAAAVKQRRNPVVVGLDPRKNLLPAGLLPTAWGDEVDAIAQAYRSFCYGVIDVVAPIVPAVKPQAAFFEQLGPAGMRVLIQVVEYARKNDLIVILDGKRNDIGPTAEAYADAYLGVDRSVWHSDALTINPYLGEDSLAPFATTAEARNSGVFVLVKTSNPGGAMIQDLIAEGIPIYTHVARHVEELARRTVGTFGYGAVGAVVGATFPEQLAALRETMPHAWILVPGYGSQGGTAQDTAGGFDKDGLGALVNNSRGIIFAHTHAEYRTQTGDSHWQRAVESAARDMIEQVRAETHAGRL